MTSKEAMQVELGNALMRAMIMFLYKAAQVGAAALMEHPGPPHWRPGNPSAWLLPELIALESHPATNVYDFEPFPNVRRWLDDMRAVKAHDEVHVVLAELGDISVEPPDMESIKNANKRALSTLKASLEALSG